MRLKGTTDRDLRREQLARDIVRTSYLVGDYILSSGRRSRYYFDKYLFETKPYILRSLARLLAEYIPPTADRIAGQELGGVALATALSLETGAPFLIIKKDRKDYATAKSIEGELYPGERVVVVEDVLTTGAQAIAAAQEVQNYGAEVLFILGVLDREEGAQENVAAAGFQMKALFTRRFLEAYT